MATTSTTPAQLELIKSVTSMGLYVSDLANGYEALSRRMRSLSSFDAPSAADWPSTPSGSRAASKRSARLVSVFSDLPHLIIDSGIGQSTLPSSCPVCEHNPVAGEDCKPNKSLRTTIKVFLRTAEKKLEALRLKDEKNTPPDTPVLPEPTPVEQTPNVEETQTEPPATTEVKAEEEPSAEAVDETLHNAVQITQAEQDIPQQSIEVSPVSPEASLQLTSIQEIAPGQEPIAENELENKEEGTARAEEGDDTQGDANGHAGLGVSQTPGFGAGLGFDPTAVAGGFPAMGFGTDMSQMQMMMAMQSGMGAGNFGNFPMMGKLVLNLTCNILS